MHTPSTSIKFYTCSISSSDFNVLFEIVTTTLLIPSKANTNFDLKSILLQAYNKLLKISEQIYLSDINKKSTRLSLWSILIERCFDFSEITKNSYNYISITSEFKDNLKLLLSKILTKLSSFSRSLSSAISRIIFTAKHAISGFLCSINNNNYYKNPIFKNLSIILLFSAPIDDIWWRIAYKSVSESMKFLVARYY